MLNYRFQHFCSTHQEENWVCLSIEKWNFAKYTIHILDFKKLNLLCSDNITQQNPFEFKWNMKHPYLSIKMTHLEIAQFSPESAMFLPRTLYLTVTHLSYISKTKQKMCQNSLDTLFGSISWFPNGRNQAIMCALE